MLIEYGHRKGIYPSAGPHSIMLLEEMSLTPTSIALQPAFSCIAQETDAVNLKVYQEGRQMLHAMRLLEASRGLHSSHHTRSAGNLSIYAHLAR
jgi:hypothetical protein